MDGHIMRCGTIGSCQSAATSEIVKVLLVTSLTHVSGAITGVLTFTFTFLYSNTVIGTLAVDGCDVTFGTTRRCLA